MVLESSFTPKEYFVRDVQVVFGCLLLYITRFFHMKVPKGIGVYRLSGRVGSRL